MSYEMSIQPRLSTHGIGGGAIRDKTTAPLPAAPIPKAQPVQTYTNPDLRLDPALGLVVIEFHDDLGKLTSSFPTQRQINAYRMHTAARPGQPAQKADDGKAFTG